MSYINKVNTGDGTHLIEPTLFAVAAGTSSAYTAAIDGFALVAGVVINVEIDTANAANATLNVNSTGAKAIRYEGSAIAAGMLDGRVYSFICTESSGVYYWDLISYDDRVELVDMMEAT